MGLWSLVLAQFLLAAALTLSTRWWPIPWFALLLSMPGIALAVWAWGEMGLRKIRVHPSTTDATRLLTRGPYRFVRHPMYAGLLWFTAALVVSDYTWWRLCLWFILLLILRTKAVYEEGEMRSRFVEYADYSRRVGRFLPIARA
jgi:protein-S-isoprenylcysteine O-methyltransferase Ste14